MSDFLRNWILPASYTETLAELIADVLIENGEYTEETIITASIAERIEKAAPYIFENYDIFDEEYRAVLNAAILKHYYTREIGAETPELFQFYLNREMSEIMPYYNKLFLSETLEFNPLYTVKKRVEHKGDGSESTLNNEKRQSDTERVNAENSETENNLIRDNSQDLEQESVGGFNDTPQGAVSGIIGALTPGGSGYLTNAQIGKTGQTTASAEQENGTAAQELSRAEVGSDKSEAEGSVSRASVDNYIDNVEGYEGHPSELIQEYRKTILNINLDIINRLNTCFMGIY